MPPVLPIPRSAPGSGNPVLTLFSTFDWTHPLNFEPSVHVQQTCDQVYTVQGAPGGVGNPNSLGYTVPSYNGLPVDPDEADYTEHAEMTAVAAAIAIHWLGRHRGSGEFANGQRSGPLYIKHFGICSTLDGSDPTPMQFHPADAISGTQPALLETLASPNDALCDLASDGVGWERFSAYNANGVTKSFNWMSAFVNKYQELCENFTLHAASGPTQLCYHDLYLDDNENWLRSQHFHLPAFVNDSNKATFHDYNPADPTHLLGYSIPGYAYLATMQNHVLQADGVSELTRFQNEPIWSELVNGVRTTRTFKQRFLRMISEGIISGTMPLDTANPLPLRNDLNSFGREIQFEAFRRCNTQVFQQVLGYTPRASQYLCFKGQPKFDEDGLYRYQNFGWDEQQVDMKFTQSGGSSPEDFDVAAGLIEAARRLDLADPTVPIRVWCRISASNAGTRGWGRFTWMKALWRFCHDRGVYNFNFFLERQSDMTPLRTAWLEFRAALPVPASITATAPSFSGGAPVTVIPVAGGNPFANPRGDLMVRVTNNSGSSVTAAAIAQIRVRPADRIYPAQAVSDMSVTVAPGEVKSIGPIPTAFCDVMGNVRISCSAQANVLIEPYRIG